MTRVRDLAACFFARGLIFHRFALRSGRGNAGRLMHPQLVGQNKMPHHNSHHRYTRTTRRSARNGLRLLRTLPGDRALLTPSLEDLTQLDANP